MGIWTAPGCVKWEDIVDEQEKTDNQRLGDLDPVDTSEDINTIGAENGNGGHVSIVEPSEINHLSQIALQLDGDNNIGDTKIDKVDYQHRDCGEGWYEKFMTPANIKEVIADAK